MEGEASKPLDEDRVAELLRVNAELAAEIRSLRAGRTANPRSAPMPAARRVGRIQGERDSLASQLEDSRRELEAANAHREALEREKHEVSRHNEELSRQNDELADELARLRSGASGLARRVRARILRS